MQLNPSGGRLGPSEHRLLHACQVLRLLLVSVDLVPLPPVVSRCPPVGHDSSCTAAVAASSRWARGQLLPLSCWRGSPAVSDDDGCRQAPVSAASVLRLSSVLLLLMACLGVPPTRSMTV